MPLEEALKWLLAAAGGLGAGLSIWNWFQSPSKKNADDLEKFKSGDFTTFRKAVGEDIKLLDAALEATTARVTTLEQVVHQMPDKDMVHRLELQLEQINTRIAGMAASAEATQRTAARVEQFLLDASRK